MVYIRCMNSILEWVIPSFHFPLLLYTSIKEDQHHWMLYTCNAHPFALSSILLLFLNFKKGRDYPFPHISLFQRSFMAPMLSSWPWDNLGAYKYLLYGPLVAKVLSSRPWEGEGGGCSPVDLCCFHILIISAIRCYVYHMGTSFGNLLFLVRNKRIIKDGVDYDQIDKEWHWDNFVILQAFVGLMSYYMLQTRLDHLPGLNMMGFLSTLVLHVIISEPLFYWVHRSFHTGYLYKNYHYLHHSIRVPQSFTAGIATPLEHMALCAVMGIPLIGTLMMGFGSLYLIYGYILSFDLVRAIIHSNLEIVPVGLFKASPTLKYFISTPTYHTLHHKEKTTNFCLFMPLFDAFGNTLHKDSWQLHKKIRSSRNEEVPDFVFLAHVVDVTTSIHSPFVFRSCNSIPFSTKIFMLPVWPVAFVAMLLMWVYSKPFLFTFYNLRDRLHQTWVVPRYGFQYFLPFAKDSINNLIEMAILRADKMGVKVLSLAALNKNEALNGGGTLFVKKHPNLRVRIVHGNTLTAAVIINEIPNDAREVFLTGATSKLGRAIALYLCRKRIRVLMLTLSTERFQRIQKEALPEFQQYLLQVTKYQAAQNCKTWIVGKWLTLREQKWAPSGTHFHQFVVPPIFGFRRDCTYGKLAAMRLPPDVQGLGSCEYTLDRGVVHACHAGGLVHFLEGWDHHEVGSIDVGRIDLVWKAALRHGLRRV